MSQFFFFFNDFSGPSASDFRVQNMSVSELVELYDCGKLSKKWNTPQNFESKSRFIESIILGIPQPTIFIDGSGTQWIPIDCSLQLTAMYEYIHNKYFLSGLAFSDTGYHDCFYDNLLLSQKSNLLNTKFEVVFLNPGVSASARFGLYLCRLGTQNETLSRIRTKIFPAYQHVVEKRKRVEKRQAEMNNRPLRITRNNSKLIERHICDMMANECGSPLNPTMCIENQSTQILQSEQKVKDILNSDTMSEDHIIEYIYKKIRERNP